MTDDENTMENETDKPEGEEEVTFGTWLKSQRAKSGTSLEEIAAVTKIHIVQLQNIENDVADNLPSMAFVRGFLVNYARHLNIDEDEVLERFKKYSKIEGSLSRFMKKRSPPIQNQSNVKILQTPYFAKAPGAQFKPANKKSFTPQRKHIIPIVVVSLLIATMSLLVSLGSKDTQKPTDEISTAPSVNGPQLPPPAEADILADDAANEEVDTAPPPAEIKEEKKKEEPKVEAAVKSTPVVAPPPKVTPEKVEKTPPVTAGKVASLEIRGIEPSWIKVRVDDKSPEGVQLESNAKNNYSVKSKVVLSLSNAGAVEIKWNGQWYQPPGFRGDVKSITLPDQLESLKKK